MIRSLRTTLSLWYLGMLMVTLCLFGGVLYTTVSTTLARDIDDVLASQADGDADALFAFWRAGRDATPTMRGGTGAAASSIDQDIAAGHLPTLVARWATETGEWQEARPVRLLSQKGTILGASASFVRLGIPFVATSIEAARHGRTIYETFDRPERRVRVITRPIIEAGHVLYLVQVAASLRQADASLYHLRLWLLWLIPVTLVVTSAVGHFLATVALRPVGRLIQAVRQIRAEDLQERIEVPRTGDELEQLAVTFNEMLARLERAFRRLRQFSAAASHELRTPLTIMRGELEVALRQPRSDEEYHRVLTTQLQALEELSAIVEQLLTLARSETGRGAVDWQPVDLEVLVRRIGERWRTIAEGKGMTLELTAPASVWVRGEGRLLERLVANLLENAFKHTPAGGAVTLEIVLRETRAGLIVRDTGPGIPAEVLPTLFDQFFSRRRDPGVLSFGLGLGLCRWIAEAHQGRIEVSSTPGAGAVFTVWLPVVAPLVAGA